MWECFLLHRSLSRAQVLSPVPLSLSLLFFFCLLPYPVTWRFSGPFRSLRFSAGVQMSCVSCSTCKCIFNGFAGGGELPVLLLLSLEPILSTSNLNHCVCPGSFHPPRPLWELRLPNQHSPFIGMGRKKHEWVIKHNTERNLSYFYSMIPGPMYSGSGRNNSYIDHGFKVICIL